MPLFNFNDSVNYLSKLTWRRCINIIKVYSSYLANKLSSKPIQWGLPISVAIEPTTSCNLRCPECPSGLRAFTRPTGMLEQHFFTRTIDSIAKDISYLIFYFQGEPYLNPAFLDMVKHAHKHKIYTATSTNAHYLTKENATKTVLSGLDRLIISIDGTTQEVYEQYRIGGKLSKVLEGARNIVAAKQELKSKTPFIIFQFLVVKPNEHQIKEVQQLAKQVGVDQLRLKTAQVYDYITDPNQLIPNNKKYSRYKYDDNGNMQYKANLANTCWRIHHAPVITWDGLVVPCCFDKDATHQLGNLQMQDFKTIWKNENYQYFRQQLKKGRNHIDICTNCSEGAQVWE